MPKLEVGQKLWFETNSMANRYAHFEVTVQKVGRKWATVTGGSLCNAELSISTLEVIGHVCALGQCFLSKEAFEEHRAITKNWRHVRHSLQSRPPAGLTLAQLLQAMHLLGVEPQEVPESAGEQRGTS